MNFWKFLFSGSERLRIHMLSGVSKISTKRLLLFSRSLHICIEIKFSLRLDSLCVVWWELIRIWTWSHELTYSELSFISFIKFRLSYSASSKKVNLATKAALFCFCFSLTRASCKLMRPAGEKKTHWAREGAVFGYHWTRKVALHARHTAKTHTLNTRGCSFGVLNTGKAL